jgi:hypothetical protein
MLNFTEYFPRTWGSKIPFSSGNIPCDEFQPIFWNLLSAHEESNSKKKAK